MLKVHFIYELDEMETAETDEENREMVSKKNAGSKRSRIKNPDTAGKNVTRTRSVKKNDTENRPQIQRKISKMCKKIFYTFLHF